MACILVIDDDVAVRRMIRTVLERGGHTVVEAGDGAEGMKLYHAHDVDVVITDLYMPGQDGIETIQLLREEAPDCRILAISGGASVGSEGPLRDARMLGANDVLAKPFDRAQLLDAVKRLQP
ncbi:response regulator [soil metagenome]